MREFVMETMMTLRLIILFCAMMAVSACVVEPYGDSRGYYYGNEYHGDDGHRVWH
jgi:hypothetical protein